ncbi:hypothetical protein LTR12_016430 [Friedmanniomyces endolithicus]|nr:hypothetical protein LTR12_016430 [Friedmanniomyces endolithicus]
MKRLPWFRRGHVEATELAELSEPSSGIAADTKRMEELGRKPWTPLERRFVHGKAVWGLASTVVITWQNMVLLSPIALLSGGLAGFFWASIVVFAAMWVVYIGLREKAERWPVAAGQYYWVAQLAPRRYAKSLSYLSGWKLMSAWQVFLAAGVMIIGNGIAALVVYLNGSSPIWLPTVVGIITTILIFVVNRWCPQGLARAEYMLLIFHLTVFVVFMAVLLGLRKHSGLPYAMPRDMFLIFRNGGGWNSMGAAVVLTAVVPMSSAIGYDCIIHLGKPAPGNYAVELIADCVSGEEIQKAASIVPKVFIWAYSANCILGLCTVVAVTLSINDIDTLLSTPLSLSGPVGPVVQMLDTATASRSWTTAVFTLLLLTLIPCCINSNTSASRQLWAFAEDGALPNSAWIGNVDLRAS